MRLESILLFIIKFVAYVMIFLMLLYLIILVKYIVKNLPIECSGKQDFDPTKTYTTAFNFPPILEKTTGLQSINGSITGTKSSATSGSFTITFTSVPKDNSKPSTDIYPGQLYTYEKSTCSITFTLTPEVNKYLTSYDIDLNDVAKLVPNDGIRLTGNYTGLDINIPLSVTAFPS